MIRLKVARSELDKMMLELKGKQDALQEVETKVCRGRERGREGRGDEEKKRKGTRERIEFYV